jgi:hypothetical protein
MAKKKAKTRGFSNVAKVIAKRRGISLEQAQHILAGATRRQSARAKRNNPRLKRVKGKPSKRKKMFKKKRGKG